MGGDHKCPVCDATFTRPQHVARHMRSHTGDRPYKCQFCGDQFARSDLLARHVNKCHANEKPLLAPPGARRKGSASTSRATTSKQACDQCVQNSLPCDGANPCSKCTQRKIRCTFVKFHRQTAPVGPGHNAPQLDVLPHSTASRHPPLSPSRDEFQLSPTSINPPSMADNLFSEAFMFPQVYSDNTHTHAVSMGEANDFSSRYRARADFLRTGDQVALGVSSSAPTHTFSDTRAAWGNTTGGSWDHPRFDQEKAHRQHQYPPSGTSVHYPHSTKRRNSEFEMDLESSDGSTSSIPSSSAGSEVHLPLPPASAQARGTFNSSNPAFSQALADSPTSYVPSFHPASFPNTTSILHHAPAQSFDESAFGTLSLDDPALLTTNAPPFFPDVLSMTHPSIEDPNITPMPRRPTTTTESDSDLWRAFMRSTPITEHPHHPRRASVPAPTSYTPYTPRPNSSQPPFHHPRYISHTHTHHHPDDLSRYQQAILARAQETETVLRPPKPKIRRRTLDTTASERERQRIFEIAESYRKGSRPPSASSSGSSVGSDAGAFVMGDGVSVSVERERDREMMRPGVKRGLSGGGMGGEPESKRRVLGEGGVDSSFA